MQIRDIAHLKYGL